MSELVSVTRDTTDRDRTQQGAVLGIDIGSLSVAVALLAPDATVVATGYALHAGDLAKGLQQALDDIQLSDASATVATTATPSVVQACHRYDDKVALIRAARQYAPGFGSILLIGGERFGLLCFDQEGRYRSYRTNTSCAAGTGSFLDQQAVRLNLGASPQLSELALANREIRPRIASRCAVFAKTDLIHAQQEGFSVEAICDGLCHCLAKNVVDTLFGAGRPSAPVLVAGGVALNRAVVAHLGELVEAEVFVHPRSHLLGAIGAALSWLDDGHGVAAPAARPLTVSDLLSERKYLGSFTHPPLQLRTTSYPDFEAHEHWLFAPIHVAGHPSVEVDAYTNPGKRIRAFLGIDIGSTSTKAVLIDPRGEVLVGVYTRTSGVPVRAVQALLEALDSWSSGAELELLGVATTGSGRKLIGTIVHADLVLDEITAHARAAIELDPAVDTILEIGGQDSKFTTLRDGQVTSAIMNNVCAAGTGSFIEEQAQRLGCDLSELSRRTEGVCAPPACDRCTVFIQRDLNNLLTEGYSTEEVLAAVLHSVRENYLVRVAVEREIGEVVLFQGATAKNKSLVAAFEQRLGKPIKVSRYCHLTGALGAALTAVDDGVSHSQFRGLDLYRHAIPLRFETCEHCTNCCTITVADLEEGPEAYGFLCGRDYETTHFVKANGAGFDPVRARAKAFAFSRRAPDPRLPTIGIPWALHLVEDLDLWRYFFNQLGFATMTSDGSSDPVARGKKLSGAEFCAPVAALFGHVEYLLGKADYVFLPFYFTDRQRPDHGVFCYYTQFTPALVTMLGEDQQHRVLTPVVHGHASSLQAVRQLHRCLAESCGSEVSLLQVASAYDRARRLRASALASLKRQLATQRKATSDVTVLLIGRPYLMLSDTHNHGIPQLLSAQGVKTFFQEMLDYTAQDVTSVAQLRDEIHWRYASSIVEAAEVVAATPGLYPVVLTAFHCSPDSFTIPHFVSIMRAHRKPYLILELDEHDSRVGYETRIEAAVRTFRTHWLQKAPADATTRPCKPSVLGEKINGRTVIFPSWDPLSCRLLVACLRREGIDAEPLRETPGSIRRSLSHNNGQCIPVNAIAQGFMEHVAQRGLDPSRTLLWMVRSDLSCNLHLYAHHIKTLLEDAGAGMEGAGLYIGKLSFADISPRASVNAYFAYLFAGMLRRMACRIRPYELEPGATDRAIEQALSIFEEAMLGAKGRETAVAEVVALFEQIPLRAAETRPKVAVFGDLYARDNPVLNQGLERFIEDNGGEVVPTPYTDHVKIVAGAYFKTWFAEGRLGKLLWSKALLRMVQTLEWPLYRHFERVLGPLPRGFDDLPETLLEGYNLRSEHAGESVENLLWAHAIRRQHPDLALFVQASPAFCCAALITEAMRSRIEADTGVPVVSVTYDGTGGSKNEALVPYLRLHEDSHVISRVGESVTSRELTEN